MHLEAVSAVESTYKTGTRAPRGQIETEVRFEGFFHPKQHLGLGSFESWSGLGNQAWDNRNCVLWTAVVVFEIEVIQNLRRRSLVTIYAYILLIIRTPSL
jgi:hypothetical protein